MATSQVFLERELEEFEREREKQKERKEREEREERKERERKREESARRDWCATHICVCTKISSCSCSELQARVRAGRAKWGCTCVGTQCMCIDSDRKRVLLAQSATR